MAEPGLYDELSREQLDALLDERGITVENGSGKDGNVLISDVRDALLAADSGAGGDGEAASPAAPAPKKGKKVEITRETDRAWWCPICDRSHAPDVGRCDGCQAERDGDHVISAG